MAKAIEMPIYDFTTHRAARKRSTLSQLISSSWKGSVLASEELRNLMDIKVFVDTDDDIRLIRRQRGTWLNGAGPLTQSSTSTWPRLSQATTSLLSQASATPTSSCQKAGPTDVALDMLTTKVRDILRRNDLAEKEAE